MKKTQGRQRMILFIELLANIKGFEFWIFIRVFQLSDEKDFKYSSIVSNVVSNFTDVIIVQKFILKYLPHISLSTYVYTYLSIYLSIYLLVYIYK